MDRQELEAPSQTAMMVALGRHLHLLRHGPRAVLADGYGWPFVGAGADGIVATARAIVGDLEEPMCTWFAARSRLAEDWLAEAAAQQYVVLGAGLDSFAWRQAGGVRVFEVDRPATQGWKRARVEELRLPVPAELSWVAVDFEHDRLASALDAAGLDPARSPFVSWLGVIPYLTRDAVLETLRQLPPCSLAVGYLPPGSDQDEEVRELGAVMEGVVASLGEPWLTVTTSAELVALLGEAGFTVVEDVGARDIGARYGLPAANYERLALARNDR